MLGFYPHTYRALCTQRNTSWGNIPGEFLVKVSLSPLISWQRHTRVLLPGISHSGIRSSPTSVPEDWPQTHRAQSGKRRILFLNNGDFFTHFIGGLLFRTFPGVHTRRGGILVFTPIIAYRGPLVLRENENSLRCSMNAPHSKSIILCWVMYLGKQTHVVWFKKRAVDCIGLLNFVGRPLPIASLPSEFGNCYIVTIANSELENVQRCSWEGLHFY